jgi:hypothetical protein
VLFEMLTGRRLREITDDVEGWRQVASGLVPLGRPFRPDLPPALERVLTAALAPDPRGSLQDARALVAAAREALAGVLALAPPARRPSCRRCSRPCSARHPRPPTAPSKVIRLVSKFLPHATRADHGARSPRRAAPPPAPRPRSAPPATAQRTGRRRRAPRPRAPA